MNTKQTIARLRAIRDNRPTVRIGATLSADSDVVLLKAGFVMLVPCTQGDAGYRATRLDVVLTQRGAMLAR